ncbi:MAG: hypothetical protein K2Y39_20165 [Candidatus Obscuribacterales bacterium]|nr:hypothetical protein [Candidatus Obscuribacterales bacterium]
MDVANKQTEQSECERITFFIGTYGCGVTSDFISRRKEDPQRSLHFLIFDNPFIHLAGTPAGFVIGYEDWTHARHVTNLNGCMRHQIALLKVELSVDSLARLVTEGKINVLNDAASQRIWQVSIFDLTALADEEATFTVLAPTGYPAAKLDELELSESLLKDLRSARTDCLQALFIAMVLDKPGYADWLKEHNQDYGELFDRVVARLSMLSQEELQAVIGLA